MWSKNDNQRGYFMFIKSTAFIILVFSLVSCQKNDTDLMQEAQACLNNSPASQARSCVSQISSVSTPAAFKLKCAAIYISEGFGAASSLITALNKINDNGASGCTGNCSSTIAVMHSFKFSSGDNSQPSNRTRNLATADEAVTTCGQTGSKAYVQISSLFKLGTLASMTAYATPGGVAGAEPTEDEIKAAVASLSNDDVGTIAATTYQITCIGNENPSDATVKLCTELETAIGTHGTNYTAIGDCLKHKLVDTTYVCP